MTYFSDKQITQLLRPINARRVNKRDGLSYLEAYDVRAHLTRLLGFGRWSQDLLDLVLLFEDVHDITKDGKTRPAVSVGYRATVRLTVCAPDGTKLATYTEAATGDASNFPVTKRADAHDFAVKTAESQALKRCAVNLGDQFGLSLYAKGSTAAIVGRTLFGQPKQPEDAPQSAEPVDAHVTDVPPEDEHVDEKDEHEQSTPPTEPEPDAREMRVKDLTAQLLTASTRAQVAGITGQVLKEKLGGALTDDNDGNVLTLGALADAVLKHVTKRGAA